MGWLRRRKQTGPLLVVELTARLMPLDRVELFEDPLDEHLRSTGLRASVTGGGTLVSPEGEPVSCEIEVLTDDAPADVAQAVASFLQERGATVGSAVRDESGAVLAELGEAVGLALYLNGTDLPPEVYAASDTNELADAVAAALGDAGLIVSAWQGPRDTALYIHARDEQQARARLTPLMDGRADMQLSRLERFA